MFEQLVGSSGKVLGIKVSGKLTDEDYKIMVPHIEKAIEREGQLKVLIVLDKNFEGWDKQAAWDEFKFDVKHHTDVERLAVVGDSKLSNWMTLISKFFVLGQVKHFDEAQLDEAWKWIRESEGMTERIIPNTF